MHDLPTPAGGSDPQQGRTRRKRTPDDVFSGAVILGGAVYAVIMIIVVMIVCVGHGQLIGVSFAVVFASATVGVVGGFTFGIPKVDEKNANEVTSNGRLLSNSNYGKLSDWLTTIIVGLGIAQFGRILDGFRWMGTGFADAFAEPLGLGREASGAYGVALVISSFGIAFVLMFMWTSIRYAAVARGEQVVSQGPG